MNGGETITLYSVDGLALDARVHSPAATASDARGAIGGAVVLAHGMTVDLDEGGMYRRLADQLVAAGLGVLRFSFRGHGASAGTQRGVTIAGELLDIEAAIAYARAGFDGPLTVLGSSFGAVAVLESSAYTRPDQLVLWNPILDLRHTFIEPELLWGRTNFLPTRGGGQ
ncbi:MAG: alpha/beta hydrolase [Pseudonocardia sp.]